MTEFIQRPDEAAEIDGIGRLRSTFADAGKPADAWKVGTEYEKLGVDARTGMAAPYSGPAGIEAVLGAMAERYGWEPRHEEGRIVALYREDASVTLEPGAQLELSGEQCPSIHCASEEFRTHSREIVSVGRELGIAFLGLGMQPVSEAGAVEMVPKRRYGIMAPYMATAGTLGVQMMKETATVQANFDYADEADAMEKMRVAMGLTPIVSAMFANSSVSGGRRNGYMTMRGHIWTETDSARTGLLRFVFENGAGFDDYIRWALAAPMYFTMRDGKYVSLTGVPFEHFLTHGHSGMRATMGDWSLHLTTLFPEVRLKTYIEVRSADSQPPHLVLAVPALWKGVLYERDCLAGAWDLVKQWSWSQRLSAYNDAHAEALQARVGRLRLLDLARELAVIAREALRRQAVTNAQGLDETIYLDPLDELLRSGKCSARHVAESWEDEWREDVSRLIDFSAYREDDLPELSIAT